MTLAEPFDSAPEARRIGLFETPVTVVHLKGSERMVVDLRSRIEARRREDRGVERSNRGGWHSDTGMIHWGGPAAGQLVRLAVRVAQQLSAFRETAPEDYAWTVTMWANVSGPGALNQPHIHPGNLWAAVFYVDLGDGEDEGDVGGSLYFEDPRYPVTVLHADRIQLRGVNGEPQPTQAGLPVRRGDLVLFPAWLRHGVSEYKGSRERISVAMNIDARVKPQPAPAGTC